MRWSREAFWDFPLTPRKVRAEQEQKAEHTTLQNGAAGRQSVAKATDRLAVAAREGETDQKRRRAAKQDDTIIAFTADQ